MPTIEEVNNQIKAAGSAANFLPKKEIAELPSILWEDEKIEKITRGIYANGSGILVATNKRVVFIDKGMLWGLRVEDFSYDKITSLLYKSGFMSDEITIFCSGNKAEITHTHDAKNFVEYVRARITPVSESVAPKAATPLTTNNDDFISKLERLAVLKTQGILTEEEFLEQKARILSSQ